MKVRLTVLSLILLCSLVAGCVTTNKKNCVAPPPPPAKSLKAIHEKGIVKVGAHLREAPSKQAKVITTVAAGTEVRIIQTLNNWYKISMYDGREGYIFHKLLRIASPCSTAALSPVNAPPGRFNPPKTYFIIHDTRLRSGPGTEYEPPITMVQAGLQFTADGYSRSWYHGTVQNMTGWIKASQLGNKLPSNNPQKTVQQQNNPFNGQPQPPIAAMHADRSPLAQQPQSPINSQPSQAQSAAPAEKARISSTTLVKLRSHPSQFGKVIEELSPGTEVTVLENQGNWCKIKAANDIGFVTSDSLLLSGK